MDLSVSAGLATLSDATRTLAELFALADRRLYLAKSIGRDRVVGDLADDWTSSGQASQYGLGAGPSLG
jgi:hypothetical protein